MTLKDYRLAASLTQKQLAEKLGTSYQLVQKYERGDVPIKSISLDRALEYAAALGITPEELANAGQGNNPLE